MSVDSSNIPSRQAARRAAKSASDAATQAYLDSVTESVTALADQVGVRGPGRAVVFTADVVWATQDCEEDREALVSAIVAGPTGRVTLSAASTSMEIWGEAVEVWHELREALGRSYLTDVPAGMIVDLDGAYVALYEPMYCPDMDDPEPAGWLDLTAAVSYAELDVFEALLAGAAGEADLERRVDGWEGSLESLIERYDLPVPTKPAHAEGDCDFDRDSFGPDGD